MDNRQNRVVLITGASSGIGRACADHLHLSGYRVYGASRSALTLDVPYGAIEMDVDDDDSVNAGVRRVLSDAGRIDIAINCAGFGIAGSVEDTSIAEAKAQMETNFFGTMRVCCAVLPVMRAQRSGHIVNVSSIAGVISVPFQGLYSASKYAMEGLTEALRMEVRPYGIRVILVEPGDLSTGFTANRMRTQASGKASPYTEALNRALAVAETDELHGPPPTEVAQLVERVIRKDSPRLRYTVGPWPERVAIFLKKILPGSWFERGLSMYYKVA
ncbi:MAG: SDR family oxidoreductase [Chloroflexi bacterium]|nr:SDR family oxidoreductase [Chloroflexota bacterium]